MKTYILTAILFILISGFILLGAFIPSSQLMGRVYYRGLNNKIALTFDDGPSIYTERILEILDEKNVKATFFIIGVQVQGNENIVRRIAEKHEIACHSYTHPFILYNDMNKEISYAKDILESVSGAEVQFWRPPYGFRSKSIIDAVNDAGMEVATWSNFPRDYMDKGSDEIVSAVIDTLKHGDIIVLHDGGGDRTETIKALPVIIDKAREMGFEFVGLSELLI